MARKYQMGNQVLLLFNPSPAACLWAAGGRSPKLLCHFAKMPILVVNPRQVSAASPRNSILEGSSHRVMAAPAAGVLQGLWDSLDQSSKQTRLQYNMYRIQTKPPENKDNIPINIYLDNNFPVSSQSLVSTCAMSR